MKSDDKIKAYKERMWSDITWEEFQQKLHNAKTSLSTNEELKNVKMMLDDFVMFCLANNCSYFIWADMPTSENDSADHNGIILTESSFIEAIPLNKDSVSQLKSMVKWYFRYFSESIDEDMKFSEFLYQWAKEAEETEFL